MAHVNMYLGTGLTMMRIGNIVAPPVFGVLLALIAPAAAWAVVAAILGFAALGFVLVGPGPIQPEPDEPRSPPRSGSTWRLIAWNRSISAARSRS